MIRVLKSGKKPIKLCKKYINKRMWNQNILQVAFQKKKSCTSNDILFSSKSL